MRTANIKIAHFGQILTTADFFEAMPGLPKQTVYSLIRKIAISSKIKHVSRRVFELITKAEFAIDVTSQMEIITKELSPQILCKDLCV